MTDPTVPHGLVRRPAAARGVGRSGRATQAGYWQLWVYAWILLGLTDLALTARRALRRQSLPAGGAATIPEPGVAYLRRLAHSAGRHLLAWLLIAALGWMIVGLGPLRPVHEWLR